MTSEQKASNDTLASFSKVTIRETEIIWHKILPNYTEPTLVVFRDGVKMELQADFYAGIWAHYAQATENIIQPSDIDDALNATNAIGDDRLQKESQGHVVPDAFTHGTAQQRMYRFKKGYETGDIKQVNNFSAADLN